MRGYSRALAAFVLAQLVIFVLSLPGLGIETRTPSEYASWAGPLFLLLTILVFILGVAALAFARSGSVRVGKLAAGQAMAAFATNLLDFSHLGGPTPPEGPLILGLVSILVAALTLWTAFASRRASALSS